MVTEGISPMLRLALCCHVLDNRRLPLSYEDQIFVDMIWVFSLTSLGSPAWLLVSKPTLPTIPGGVSVMVWILDHKWDCEKNVTYIWYKEIDLKELIPSSHPARLSGESQILSLPWLSHLPGVEQRPRRLVWCLENEWEGASDFWPFLMLGSLKPGDPASPVPALEILVLVSPCLCYSKYFLGSPQVWEHRGSGRGVRTGKGF